MKRIRLKLRGKLLLGTSILVLLPILLIGYFVNLNVYKTMTQQATRYNSHIGELVHFEVSHLIEQEKQKLALLASTQDLLSSKSRQAFLRRINSQTGYWQNVYYVDAFTGTVDLPNSSQSLPSDFDARRREWYQSALTSGISVSPSYRDILTGRQIITISSTVLDPEGNLIGVLAADLSINSLQSILDLKLAETLKENIWLIDSHNAFLYQPSDLQSLPFKMPETFTPAFLAEVQQNFITNDVYIPELNWQAIVAQNPVTAFADTSNLMIETALITFFFFIVSIAGVHFYVGRLTKPINALFQRIEAIKHGAWHGDLPPLKTHFIEIGEVSSAFDDVTENVQELLRDVIISLTTSLDARDPYTRHHSERVSIYAHLLAGYLGWSGGERENILRAGLMHDVGKIGVPGRILNKPGPLTNEEFDQMKTHCQSGYEIIQGIPIYVQSGIAQMALEHHERWDGNGYPRGLKGLEILPGARVLAIADSFDAMTSDRSYRQALSLDQALGELERGKDKQFDPEMVEVFLSIPRDILITNMTSPLQMHMDRVHLTAVE